MTNTIDILFWIPLALMSIAVLSAITHKKVNIWIGLMGIALGAVITFYSSVYTQYAIIPIRNWMFYGTDFTWHTGVSMAHIASLFLMSFIAVFNLWSSKGYSLWLMAAPSGPRKNPLGLMRELRSGVIEDKGGIAPLIAGLIVAGATVLGSFAAYQFFQNPDVTYNISNPPPGQLQGLFSAGGLGINTNLIIIGGVLLVALYVFLRYGRD